MAIAQEEIFGPVLVIIPFENEEEAIEIANDTPYGLAAYVQTGSAASCQSVYPSACALAPFTSTGGASTTDPPLAAISNQAMVAKAD